MGWQKLGHIFDPRDHEWIVSHAQVPTALEFDDYLRIYFSPRNTNGKAYIAYIDVDKQDPTKILNENRGCVLGMGNPGSFDEDGVMPGFALRDGDDILMYYSGWNQKVSTPYHNATGLAISKDGGDTFTRVYEGPIMDRTPLEPYVAVTPTILRDKNHWRMWYISGLGWEKIGDQFEPVYVIKHAESTDGISWQRDVEICVPQSSPLEAFSHPTVIQEEGLFRMWYCYRDSVNYRDGQGSYRIGYAESKDGYDWQRLDHKSGIEPSPEGWDSTMICYPFVVDTEEHKLLFYNGNGFGRTGIGVAKWQ